ncbi:5-formyltetrahydrofolate cyclo-ligase [Dactylosporangium sp. AC04546]|uniref:5-formyltetrahydrofolate cyclo-ligase n=1 Tax=Dactylosporangium sp. AC04546 TaxID=2862460 RepID=UPI002E7C3B3B|nr:5-formyltetrahydrofolate cyclo-ligase [Dactylosporangium sp. AC04546]WVK84657.1 5-formyltetrahydrofolate cyclo-ligase [Dactylosporangium sp. AC04546]
MPPKVSRKSELRAHIRSARRAMSAPVKSAADEALVDAVVSVVLRVRPTSVAAYVPMLSEPGGPRLVTALQEVAPRVLLPLLDDDLDLDWAVADGSYTAGRFGLIEPAGPRLGRAAVAAVELMFLPALAVSRSGMRLGQGGGSYDRVLPRVSAPTLVLLYPGEYGAAVPSEPHDHPVCGVLVGNEPDGYEEPHLHWTNGCAIAHHWHSEQSSANDGG